MNSQFKKTLKSEFSYIISLKQVLVFASILLMFTFCYFRWLHSQNKLKSQTIIGSILRNEASVANTYALSKSILDLENLGLLNCTNLFEAQNSLPFYDSTNKSNCQSLPFLGIQFTDDILLKAINGFEYRVKYQIPFQWQTFMLEIMAYVLILLAVSLYKRNLQNQEIKLQMMEALVLQSKQVSHDIKSPLSALNMILGQIGQLPEAQRLIIRNSVNRINDIANQLLEKGKPQQNQAEQLKQQASPVSKNNLTTELLAPIIDTIVSEKRMQFRDKQNIHIESALTQSYGLFANINVTEFGRTLSNLITNAVEALPNDKGLVKVLVAKQDSQILIRIEDNGKGIPESILNQLGQIGVTHGKIGTESGSGLGIYHAKKTIESFGGLFKINSIEGQGTKIDLILNAAPSPNWFLDKILFDTNTQVVSIDDDLSIHQIWKGRFQSLQSENTPIKHLTFTSGADFKNWFKDSLNNHQTICKNLFLFDYELLNQVSTGLDLIEELGIGEQSILITSRYEEENIRQRCEKLNVKLIPKTMAAYVPIQIQKPKELCNILIDDDSLTQMMWELDAKDKQINFKGFQNPEDFFRQKDLFDLQSLICIDSNLGHGINGIDIAKKAYEMDFKNIHLCTGYDQSEFQEMFWIKSIRGKEPFWGV